MAGALYTLVVLDEHGKLAIDCLMDAQGSKVDPMGAPSTGFGGTAARPGAAMLPWAAAGLAGLLMAGTGWSWSCAGAAGPLCMPADRIAPHRRSTPPQE